MRSINKEREMALDGAKLARKTSAKGEENAIRAWFKIPGSSLRIVPCDNMYTIWTLKCDLTTPVDYIKFLSS